MPAGLRVSNQLVELNLSYHTSPQPHLHRFDMPCQLGNAVLGVLNVSWYTRSDN